ncbi:MAG: hypothetical protein U9O06_10390 [Euryarchaeota archaeon]|nr:hypothetical protein [Euryarchaeota archaeon]
MADYRHVMYTSKSAVELMYSELFGNVDQVEIEQGSNISGSVGGKIGTFISMLSSRFSGKITRNEIHSINFDDEMWKAKRLANEILTDSGIPCISELKQDGQSMDQLYRFSCEVLTKPFESELDGETYIEVVGKSGGVEFRGDTSTENWGSRSHIIQSVRASRRGETYPYQGLVWPIAKTGESKSGKEYDVKFLLICGPKRELRDHWFDRKNV